MTTLAVDQVFGSAEVLQRRAQTLDILRSLLVEKFDIARCPHDPVVSHGVPSNEHERHLVLVQGIDTVAKIIRQLGVARAHAL